MAILVDTNILIEFLRRVPTAVALLHGQTERVTVSVITVLELYAGARSQREGHSRRVSKPRLLVG